MLPARFEQLALEYDSDEIGELDTYEDHPSLKGTATTDRFGKVLDNFLAVHNTQDHAHDSGHAYDSAADTASAAEHQKPQQSTASRQLSSRTATPAEQEAASAALARVCLSSLV